MTTFEFRLERAVPLAEHTTLELGGPAEYFAAVATRDELLEALRWARDHAQPVTLLGGGSNVVVHDRGVRGLVIKLGMLGTRFGTDGCVEAQAGESWDALVRQCVERELAGIECLSGIPGSVGAAPVQNIGAYGQELADCVTSIEVLDLQSLQNCWIDRSDCEFDYRTSRWKRQPGRELVLSVRLALKPFGNTELRYPELARALTDRAGRTTTTLGEVRQAVLTLRRTKSMVLDANDENRRSVGSFFLNPVLPSVRVDALLERARAAGVIQSDSDLPRYPQASGMVKLSAAWLIERAGTHKGERVGNVGVSSRHCLALVQHGGATSAELLALARTLQARVRDCFEVELHPEPVLLGFVAE